MRLVHTDSLELSDFTLAKPPPYAILSHTWGRDEVTFQDLSARAGSERTFQSKAGYTKIVQTCRLARERGLDYAWIDTCCIDKTSSAELTESINSMFAYYKNAEICFVYLEDLSAGSIDLAPCRWFTRGWTLQELLAPRHHTFYDQSWACIGSKSSHFSVLCNITQIPQEVLTRKTAIRHFSISNRMSWASGRQTTREEDIAYCLLGIFEVNMPLIYGEGRRAFRRLQEEIVKRNNDLSILAWEPERGQANLIDAHGTNLLAQSPADFARSRGIHPFPNDFPELAITNKGFSISPDIPLRVFQLSGDSEVSGIMLGAREGLHPGGICLRKIGPGLYCRHTKYPMIGFEKSIEDHWVVNSLPYHIVLEPNGMTMFRLEAFRQHAIYVSVERGQDLELRHAVPQRLWDPEDRAFLRPNAIGNAFFPDVIAMSFRHASGDRFVVVCDNRAGIPRLGIVSAESEPKMRRFLFEGKHRENSVHWIDLREQSIDIEWQSGDIVSRDKLGHTISVTTSMISRGKKSFIGHGKEDVRAVKLILEGNSDRRKSLPLRESRMPVVA